MKRVKRSKQTISNPKLFISAILALVIIINLIIILFYLGQKVWQSDLLSGYITKEQINLFLQYVNEKLQLFNTFVTENMLK